MGIGPLPQQPISVNGIFASDANLSISDITTNNVSTSAHGFAPKAPNSTSQFLRGDATYAAVTDANLSVSDVTTNNVSSSAHGFAPKYPNNTVTFLRGDGTYTGAAMSSSSATVSTSQTTTSTSYGDLATVGPAVTITTGTQALVGIYCGTIQNDTAADYALASIGVTGSSSITAADTTSLKLRNAAASVVGDWAFGATFLITGLTAGSNTFTMKYRVAVGGTATFANRQIWVLP